MASKNPTSVKSVATGVISAARSATKTPTPSGAFAANSQAWTLPAFIGIAALVAVVIIAIISTCIFCRFAKGRDGNGINVTRNLGGFAIALSSYLDYNNRIYENNVQAGVDERLKRTNVSDSRRTWYKTQHPNDQIRIIIPPK